MFRCHAVFAVICAILCVALPPRSGAQVDSGRALPGQSPGSPPPARSCTVNELSRQPLVVDRFREIYVEPVVVLPSGNSILFAGTPNYLWEPGVAGTARGFVQDSVFGAVLGPDGHASTVPAPIDPRLVSDPRALPVAGGGWSVVFAELKSPVDRSTRDTIVAYWYGALDGSTWTSLERLPLPPEGQMDPGTASALVQRGDTMAFAVSIRTSNGSDIAIFERLRGEWSLEIVPTRRAVTPRLTFSESVGMLLFVLGPDTTLRFDRNSAFIHARQPGWRPLRKLIQGHPEPIYDPVFSGSSRGPVLTWWVLTPGSGKHARAAFGPVEAGITTVIELDSPINHIATAQRLNGPPVWVSERIGARGDRELRFIMDSAGVAVVAARSPTPYTGYFAATGIGASDILVAGPLLRPEQPNPSLVTLLIRARVECLAGAP